MLTTPVPLGYDSFMGELLTAIDANRLHEFLFLLTAFVSEVLGTIGGFGSSTFFVPLAALLEPFEVVLVLTSLLHVAGNLTKIYLFRKDFNWMVVRQFAVPALLMTFVGALLVKYVDTSSMTGWLGWVLFLLVLIKHFVTPEKIANNKVAVKSLSALSGFMTGLFGTGGAIRAVALSALSLPKNTFIITSASIDLFGDIGRLAIYLKDFSLTREHWFYVPALILIAMLGSWFGKYLLQFVSEKVFQKIVTLMVIAVGLFLILSNAYT